MFAPPVFSDPERARHAQLVHTVIVGSAIIVNGSLAVVTLLQPGLWLRAVVAIASVNLVCGIAMILNRRGSSRTASAVLIAGLMAIVLSQAIQAGGVRSPGVQSFFILSLASALLLGWRAGIVTAVACVAITLMLTIAEQTGILPPRTVTYSIWALWGLNAMYVLVLLLVLRLITRSLTDALQRAESELAARRLTEVERSRLFTALEKRVKEVTILHSASRLLQSGRPVDAKLLKELADLIPAGWMYPECCAARIVYGDIDVTTAGWRDSPWRQSEAFNIGAARDAGGGLIEVVYVDDRPQSDEGPFLSEERSLLRSLTEMLATHAERFQMEHRRENLEQQLRQSQKMEALGSLAAGVAHDFNNLLTAIVGYAELIRIERPDGESASDARSIILTSRRAAALTHQLLAFSRNQVLKPTVIDVNDIATGVKDMLQRVIGRNISLELRLAEELSRCRADQGQIEQVILNLVVNARNAMLHGGTITLSTRNIMLADGDASALRMAAGDAISIEVQDTGEGMSDETMRRIFEPFFTTKPKDKGTGLGLSTVYGIVRQSGGAVRVRSRIGVGTTFEVILPVSVREGTATPRASVAIAASMAPATILLIDGDVGVRTVVPRMLTAAGYTVLSAEDPETALAQLADTSSRVNLIIADLAMRGMDGEKLYRRARELHGDLRVLSVTGHQDRALSDMSEDWFHLQKPFSHDELLQAVNRVMRGAGHLGS